MCQECQHNELVRNMYDVLSLAVSLYTNRFSVQKFWLLPTERNYVFYTDRETNSDFCLSQH